MKVAVYAVTFFLSCHSCFPQKLLFKTSQPTSNAHFQKTERKENIFPSNHTYSHRHVITMNKRGGIHCRSVCGKCEQILGQSWSLRCQHDCLHGGVPFLVCLKVTLYWGISYNSTHKRRTYPDQVSIAYLTVKCMPTTQTSNWTSN